MCDRACTKWGHRSKNTHKPLKQCAGGYIGDRMRYKIQGENIRPATPNLQPFGQWRGWAANHNWRDGDDFGLYTILALARSTLCIYIYYVRCLNIIIRNAGARCQAAVVYVGCPATPTAVNTYGFINCYVV
jgi:hypothetical protein